MNSSATNVLSKGGELFAKVGVSQRYVPYMKLKGLWGLRRQKILEVYIGANAIFGIFLCFRERLNCKVQHTAG